MNSIYDLFKQLPQNRTWTLDEIVKETGLDFPVGKWSLTAHGPLALKEGETTPQFEDTGVHSHVAHVRTDTGYILGVVGANYGSVSFARSWDFIEPLLEEGAVTPLAGRATQGGTYGYLHLRGKGSMKLAHGDEIINEFYCRSSHDGSGLIEVQMTPRRSADGTVIPVGTALRFKHSKRVEQRIAKARDTIVTIKREWEGFTDAVRKMAELRLKDEECQDYIARVLPSTQKNPSTKLENTRESIFRIWKNGLGSRLPASANTLFGAMQAVMFWADNNKVVRSSSKRNEDDARIEALLSGDAATKKKKAYTVALDHLKMTGTIMKLRGA